MENSNAILNELRKLNSNFERLFAKQSIADSEWIRVTDAMAMLNRAETWIRTRMIDPDKNGVDIRTIPVNWYLIKGVDWKYDGKWRIFKRTSIERLKEELQKLSDKPNIPPKIEQNLN